MPTETRPCTEAEQSAPIDRAYLTAPRLPTGALFVSGVPVSTCTPSKVEHLSDLALSLRSKHGPYSPEYQAAKEVADRAYDELHAGEEDEEPGDGEWEAEREIERLDMLGLDAWGRPR